MLIIHFYFEDRTFLRFTKGEIFGLTEFLCEYTELLTYNKILVSGDEFRTCVYGTNLHVVQSMSPGFENRKNFLILKHPTLPNY